MEHTVKVAEKKKVGDSQVAVLLQCCDEVTTRSWHTLGITSETTQADITAWLDARKADVSALHDAHIRADAALDDLIVE